MKIFLSLLMCLILSGCSLASKAPEKVYITKTKYVVLEPPAHRLQHRDFPAEPKIRTRKNLVRWQTQTNEQLILSNQDKDELKKWFEETRKQWEERSDD